MRSITITPEIEQAVRRYELACARFVPGRDSTAAVELPLAAIGTAAAAALGLPTLQDLFHGRAIPRYRPRPIKVHAAQRGARKAASGR